MIYFITGNKNKLEEVKSILPEIEQLDIDLTEIQEIDPHIVVKAKLMEAMNHQQGEFIVEDTSLYFDCLNGLPGTLIKWFLKTLGKEGLSNLVEKIGTTNKAQAKTIIGYAKNKDEIHFFEGVVEGKIVPVEGETGFGWDSIFKPDGHDKTFANMSQEEKNSISMRKIATTKLKEFLESK